jgi:FtsH-binding integral membrane protein
MSDLNPSNDPFVGSFAAGARAVDQGLRAHMLKVYNFMAGGLALTGIIAYLVSSSPDMIHAIYGTPLQWVVMLAPLGFVLWLSFGLRGMSPAMAQGVFWAYAATMGLSLSSIFLIYTDTSIAKTFLVTAGTFAATSLWGYTTKRDLTGMGSFLMMGVFGLIIASFANIFFHSSQLEMIVSFVGVLLFTALAAYDTQKIKNMYSASWSDESTQKIAIMGALQLYLDFINLFMYLLRFMGSRRN